MDGGSFASIIYFFVSCVEPSIANIVHDGIVEQHRALRDNANVRTQAVDVDISDVLTINANASLGHVVESIEQFQDGTLAGAGLPNKAKEDNSCQ